MNEITCPSCGKETLDQPDGRCPRCRTYGYPLILEELQRKLAHATRYGDPAAIVATVLETVVKKIDARSESNIYTADDASDYLEYRASVDCVEALESKRAKAAAASSN